MDKVFYSKSDLKFLHFVRGIKCLAVTANTVKPEKFMSFVRAVLVDNDNL
jgi:hypothetical protein